MCTILRIREISCPEIDSKITQLFQDMVYVVVNGGYFCLIVYLIIDAGTRFNFTSFFVFRKFDILLLLMLVRYKNTSFLLCRKLDILWLFSESFFVVLFMVVVFFFFFFFFEIQDFFLPTVNSFNAELA